MAGSRPRPLADRFHEKYIVDPVSGCWLWTGAPSTRGYGHLSYGPPDHRHGYAHRISYELHHGPIPPDKVVDHMCDVKLCVNPEHLQLLTNRENVLRSNAAHIIAHVLGQCTKGHVLDRDGFYTAADGRRLCRVCMLDRAKRYGHRNRRKQARRQPRSPIPNENRDNVGHDALNGDPRP